MLPCPSIRGADLRSRLLLAAVATVLIAACGEPERVIVRSPGEWQEAVPRQQSLFKSTIAWATEAGTIVETGFGLELLAEIPSPRWEGRTLQATDVQWVGDLVFATYNARGDAFVGALQVIDVADPALPEVVAEAIYPITDLQRVRVAGPYVYTASADADYGGTLERWTYTREAGLSYDGYVIVGSYSATYLDVDNDSAWVSFGDVRGGAVGFDLGDAWPPTPRARIEYPDARWVGHLEDDGVVVVRGSPTRLRREDATGIAEAPLEGGTVGAPTWATRVGDRLYLSADEAGLLVVDLRELLVVGTLETSGTANGLAIAADGALAFLANGEEGLVVADVREPRAPIALAAIDVLDDAGSANAVALSREWIALADGLGGVKLLRYDREAIAPDDCDGDGIPNGDDPDDDDDGVLDADDAEPCDPGVVCAPGEVAYAGRFVGAFYNLPCDHPDVEGPVTGVVTGTLPWDFDWFDDRYFSYRAERDSLLISVAQDYFPVDDGLCGDPYHFAVHWQTTVFLEQAGDYTFELGSDDDSWLFIDDVLVADLGGVHALRRSAVTVPLTAGPHRIDLWFAERKVVQSGLEFELVGVPDDGFVDFHEVVCLDPSADDDADGIANIDDLAPLDRPSSGR